MKVIRNSEIAKKYGVNKTTVANWIKSAQEGKTNLILEELDKRVYITDTSHNHAIINSLVLKNAKNKQRTHHVYIEPQNEFYTIFSQSEIGDIVSHIEKDSYIPHKYTYYDFGAEQWSQYTKNSIANEVVNTVTNTEEILRLTLPYIKELSKERVNIVDLGVGDALPMKTLIEELHKEKLIQKYIAVDASEDILKMAKKNISQWTDNGFPIETHIKDIEREYISDLLFKSSNSTEPPTRNLVFFLGSTINNLNALNVLKLLHDSMGLDDVLIAGQTLDSKMSKVDFSYVPNKKGTYRSEMVPSLLGLTRDHYDQGPYYDAETNRRVGYITFKTDCTVTVNLGTRKKELFFKKADKILVWKHTHHKMHEIAKMFYDSGLEITSTMTSKDRSHVFTFSQVG